MFIRTKNPEFVSAHSNLGEPSTGNREGLGTHGTSGPWAGKFPDNRHLAYWTKIAEDSLKARGALSAGAK